MKYTNLDTDDDSDKSALKTPTTHISDVKKGGKQNVGTAKIRSVTVETIKSKWINKTLASKDGRLWLQFKDEKGLARYLTFKICSQYVDKIKHMREFREAWVTGSQNYKVSNATDHADSASHKMAMNYYYRDVNVSVVPESDQTSLDTAFAKGDEKIFEKTKRKFEVAYFIAKEELSSKKYGKIINLIEMHGVSM